MNYYILLVSNLNSIEFLILNLFKFLNLFDGKCNIIWFPLCSKKFYEYTGTQYLMELRVTNFQNLKI